MPHRSRRPARDTTYDLPTDGQGAYWEGLNESARLSYALEIILDALGIVNEGGIVLMLDRLSLEDRAPVDRLEFYQALWVNFHPSHGIPPGSVTKCVKYLKAEVHVNMRQMFEVLRRDMTMDRVRRFETPLELQKDLQMKKNRMGLQEVKDHWLQPLLTWIGPRRR